MPYPSGPEPPATSVLGNTTHLSSGGTIIADRGTAVKTDFAPQIRPGLCSQGVSLSNLNTFLIPKSVQILDKNMTFWYNSKGLQYLIRWGGQDHLYGAILVRKPEATTAPDFTLIDTEGQSVTLSQYQGDKHVVLVFNRGFT